MGRKYFMYTISGIDYPLEELGTIPYTVDCIRAVSFEQTAEQSVKNCKLFFDEALSDTLENENRILESCNKAIEQMMICLISKTTIVNIKIFKYSLEEICFGVGIKTLVRCTMTAEFNGRIGTITKERLACILSEPCALATIDANRIIKVLSIEDSIIRFFLVYSWLYDLCGGTQKDTDRFIGQSRVHQMHGDKKPYQRDGIAHTETIYTYLRNLIGHSLKQTICFEDGAIQALIEKNLPVLVRILIEKLE